MVYATRSTEMKRLLQKVGKSKVAMVFNMNIDLESLGRTKV